MDNCFSHNSFVLIPASDLWCPQLNLFLNIDVLWLELCVFWSNRLLTKCLLCQKVKKTFMLGFFLGATASYFLLKAWTVLIIGKRIRMFILYIFQLFTPQPVMKDEGGKYSHFGLQDKISQIIIPNSNCRTSNCRGSKYEMKKLPGVIILHFVSLEVNHNNRKII